MIVTVYSTCEYPDGRFVVRNKRADVQDRHLYDRAFWAAWVDGQGGTLRAGPFPGQTPDVMLLDVVK